MRNSNKKETRVYSSRFRFLLLLRSDMESRSDMELDDDDELVMLALAARAASKRMAPMAEGSGPAYCS